MKITPIRTKIISGKQNMLELINRSVTEIPENSVLAITSKIIAIAEGRVCDGNSIKKELIKREADCYLETDSSFVLTVKNNILIPSAGIDQSNGDGQYILWPSRPFESARKIRDHLAKHHALKNVGMVITDSKTSPMRYGTTGIAIAHAGFRALNDYRGKKDLFNRELEVTQSNVADALASAAVLVMGEGNEQTPMVLITDLPFVDFDAISPTQIELEDLSVDSDADLYGPILKSADWKKGKIV